MPAWLSPDALLVSLCVAGVFLLYSTIWKDYLVQAFGVAGLALAATIFLPEVGGASLLPQLTGGAREALTFGGVFLVLQLVVSRSVFIDPFEVPAGAGRVLLLLELSALLANFGQYFWRIEISQPLLQTGLFAPWAIAAWAGAGLLTLVFFGKK